MSRPTALEQALDALGAAEGAGCGSTRHVPPRGLRPARQAQARIDRARRTLAACPRPARTPVEIAGTRARTLRDGAALTRFLAWLAREGRTAALDRDRRRRQLEDFRARDALFPRARASRRSPAPGRNGAIVALPRRRATSNRRLAPGTLYLVDSGGQYLDGTTDVTRTVAIGTPSRRDARPLHPGAQGPHRARHSRAFPTGTSGAQLDALARRALWEAGLDYDHGTGHGVGSYPVGARGAAAHLQGRQHGRWSPA